MANSYDIPTSALMAPESVFHGNHCLAHLGFYFLFQELICQILTIETNTGFIFVFLPETRATTAKTSAVQDS